MYLGNSVAKMATAVAVLCTVASVNAIVPPWPAGGIVQQVLHGFFPLVQHHALIPVIVMCTAVVRYAFCVWWAAAAFALSCCVGACRRTTVLTGVLLVRCCCRLYQYVGQWDQFIPIGSSFD